MMWKKRVVHAAITGRRLRQAAVLGALALMVLATALPAAAGPGRGDGGKGWHDRPGRGDGHRGQMAYAPWDDNPRSRDLMQGVRAWRLAEVLELSEDEIPGFIAKLKTTDRIEDEFHLEHRHSLERIALLLEDNEPDQSKLRQELDKLQSDRGAFHEKMEKQREELLAGLSLEQQARLSLFEDRFPREMRRMLHRVREGDEPRPSMRRLPPGVKCRLQELLDQDQPEMTDRPEGEGD